MAYKYDLRNKKVGKLLVKDLVPIELRPTKNHGNYWYCDCDCGTQNIMVPTSYLTGNGNYTQKSCGCDRKIKAFLASSKIGIDENFIQQFDDFEKFLFLHKQLTAASGKTAGQYQLKEYEEDILYFYYDNQFNQLYNFWKTQERSKTFYDLAKPSLDHIIPKSKNGSNKKENLQFLTVFENLSKRDMTWEEWEDFKIKTNTHSDYFLENILKSMGGLE